MNARTILCGDPTLMPRRRRRVPDENLDALTSAPVTMAARWLYVMLYRFGHHKFFDWPTQRELAAIVGASRRYFQECQGELEAIGALVVTPGKGGRSNHYRFPLPPWTPTTDVDTTASASTAALGFAGRPGDDAGVSESGVGGGLPEIEDRDPVLGTEAVMEGVVGVSVPRQEEPTHSPVPSTSGYGLLIQEEIHGNRS
jgi:hypothetical protein